MKTVNTCPVVILKEEAKEKFVVASDVFPTIEKAKEAIPAMIENETLENGEYVIAPLYWKVDVEIPEVKPKVKFKK